MPGTGQVASEYLWNGWKTVEGYLDGAISVYRISLMHVFFTI